QFAACGILQRSYSHWLPLHRLVRGLHWVRSRGTCALAGTPEGRKAWWKVKSVRLWAAWRGLEAARESLCSSIDDLSRGNARDRADNRPRIVRGSVSTGMEEGMSTIGSHIYLT